MFRKILKWLGLTVVKGKVYEYEFARGAGQIWASREGFYDGIAAGNDWFALGHAKISEVQSIEPGQIKKVKLIIED